MIYTIDGCTYMMGSAGCNIKNNNNNMKEETKKLYKLTFVTTTIEKKVYKVLAENKEDAKKVLADRSGNYSDARVEVISSETKFIKAKRVGKSLLS